MRQFTIFIFLLSSLTAFAQQSSCDSEAHHQFDFWVGEWNVYKTGTDTLVGHNAVRRILGGCVIEENWVGATGFEGKSFNTYNPQDSTWNQVWVDQSGATYHFSGRREGNSMRLKGDTFSRKGEPIQFTLEFHFDPKEGTVRQVWRMSKDEGGSWQVIFDGEYRRG